MYSTPKKEAITCMNQWGKSKTPFLFIIDYKQEKIYLEQIEKVDSTEILYNIQGFTNTSIPQADDRITEPILWEPEPITKQTYKQAFDKVKSNLYAGNSYLVNLTFPTPVKTNLTLKEIYQRASAPYKLWVKDQFVLFSPEIFVRMRNGYIYSYPMKGTIDATIPNARQIILDDPKEAAEHATITDLIRNDLSIVASDVQVKRYRYIDEIITHKGKLFQVSSEIEGKLAEDWKERIGDILFQLLPAGSISGAPKKKTMQIIADAETTERGFYTGIMGYYDGKQLESAVMIRFIEQQKDQLFYRSGGGITAQSNLSEEYNELIQKVYVPIR